MGNYKNFETVRESTHSKRNSCFFLDFEIQQKYEFFLDFEIPWKLFFLSLELKSPSDQSKSTVSEKLYCFYRNLRI